MTSAGAGIGPPPRSKSDRRERLMNFGDEAVVQTSGVAVGRWKPDT